mmetsp:Transcript_138636/g.196338  ORF Transcript_138636/g.196338 Transcript_138636/m.196338 type:complete len:101 (+) Transcript_138636:340-642(+)
MQVPRHQEQGDPHHTEVAQDLRGGKSKADWAEEGGRQEEQERDASDQPATARFATGATALGAYGACAQITREAAEGSNETAPYYFLYAQLRQLEVGCNGT